MAERRFLHIMPDDKFLDYFIEQSEHVAPGDSEYWVRTKTQEPAHVKSKLVKSLFWNEKYRDELINEANRFEKIFLHSFAPDMMKFILGLKSSVHITWIFWGYEGYNYTANQKRWYLPLTWRLRTKDSYNVNSSNWWSLGGLNKILRRKYKDYRNSFKTKKILKRVNSCATWVKYDYEMIKHINPRMTWLDYNYFSVSQLGLNVLDKLKNDYLKIWIGNSGALTNNHADALFELKNMRWGGDIYMPLSYGGTSAYREKIINIGKEYFGSRFHPITDFLPLQEYQQLINKCGVIWMNHIRQQAAGNILAALYMGKVVVLHPSSNLYKTLKSWGLQVYTDIKSISPGDITPLTLNTGRCIIERNISFEHTMVCIRNLYHQ